MTKRRGKQKARGSQKTQETRGRGWKTRTQRAYPVTLRLKVVEQVERGTSVAEAARVFGPMEHTIRAWLAAYRKGGVEALVPKPVEAPKRKAKAGTEVKRDAVLEMKESHPEYGTRRVRDALSRFEALGVSEHEVRR